LALEIQTRCGLSHLAVTTYNESILQC